MTEEKRNEILRMIDKVKAYVILAESYDGWRNVRNSLTDIDDIIWNELHPDAEDY